MEWPAKWAGEWKEPLGWVAGGCGLLILFLFLTFPYGALQARILGELQRRSGFDIRFTQTAVAFPATLEWRNVTLTNSEWGAVQLALLQAKIGVLKLLTGDFGLDVLIQTNATVPNAGVAKGTVIGSSIGLESRVSIKGQAQQIDLSTFLRRYVSRGMLNGEFLQGLESRPAGGLAMKGNGVWRAEVRDLAIDRFPLSNGLTLSLGFTRVAAALSCRDTVCDVTELKGDGPDGSFTGGGKITVQQPIQNSQLALSLTMVPGPGFASKGAALGIPPIPAGASVTVRVLGTLAQARIAL